MPRIQVFSLVVFIVFSASVASAETPRVAVDIAPVHSLVARVMDGVDTPALIIAPGASPHEYHLRPSEARALQKADVMFWVGPNLTPWLDDAISTLADDAVKISLLKAQGTTLLTYRESALFEKHDHADHDDHADHADHDDHDDHADHDDHDDHADHADHDDHDDHADHDSYHIDPHAWLSPANGGVWLNIIAEALAEIDPVNANIYMANAAAGQKELAHLNDEINAILNPVRGENYIVFHDAYQYFEASFNIPASGAIAFSDASQPGPARIATIKGRVEDEDIGCVLSEPQFNPGIIASVMDDMEVDIGVLDAVGYDLNPGRDLYPELLRNLAKALAECLG